jgi:hypothetical protein
LEHSFDQVGPRDALAHHQHILAGKRGLPLPAARVREYALVRGATSQGRCESRQVHYH